MLWLVKVKVKAKMEPGCM